MAGMKDRSAAPAGPRPPRRRLLAAVLLLAFGGCFSFRVTVPDDPDCVVGTVAVVRADPTALDYEKPIADEPLAEDDAGATVLVKVLQVSRPLVLQWHWYSPDNALARRSKTVVINSQGKYLAYFAAWDTLPRSYYAEKKGTWTVVITCDDSFLARKEFTVN